uniref:EXPERA domain-containing protein n=1 Tax=Biomphalaria glabrata TaxID=6526 RepID=A0A2C9LI63_BIOGL
MTKLITIGVVILSLTSWPLLFALSQLSCMKNERNVFIAATSCILAAFVGTSLLFRRYYRNIDPVMYVFSIFCFDSVSGLGNILEVDGYFQLQSTNWTQIDPYLKTAHGTVSLYWNGIVHFLLCLLAIYLYTQRYSHREVSLYWAGSLLNNMIVLLPVYLIGSNAIRTSTFGNIIHLLLAIGVLFYYFHNSPSQARTFLKFSPIWKRPVDFFFIIFFLLATIVAVFRGLAILGASPKCMTDYLKLYEPYLTDPSNFPKFQALTYQYIYVIYYLFAIYGLLHPGQHWMADWSLIHAGAAAQAQFSYIAGSLHHRTAANLHPPLSGTIAPYFWGINIAFLVIPQLFALWCRLDDEHFGRSYTVELSTPITSRPLRPEKKSQ